MHSATQAAPASPAKLWAARIMSAIVVVFLLFDGITKVMRITPVIDAFEQLGIPVDLAPAIGVIVTVCALVYAIPRTSILGAILLTGLYGGAVAIHMRAGSAAFPAYIFPIMMGALTWGPLFLRDTGQLRALIPVRAPGG